MKREINKRAAALFLKSKTVETTSGCWEWQGGRHGVGYGSLSKRLGGGYAHRAMYEAIIGPIPPSAYVLHTCDNRICINPEHLFLGSHIDNIRDMHAKKRQRGGSMPNEENPSCKFTDDQIRSMRARTMSIRAMVRHFGISESQLLRILRGDSRKGI